MNYIDFDEEKNRKNITRLQKMKWRLNSRWPLKIVFGRESTNTHFFLDFFSESWIHLVVVMVMMNVKY
jgi:hypothetical protein